MINTVAHSNTKQNKHLHVYVYDFKDIISDNLQNSYPLLLGGMYCKEPLNYDIQGDLLINFPEHNLFIILNAVLPF